MMVGVAFCWWVLDGTLAGKTSFLQETHHQHISKKRGSRNRGIDGKMKQENLWVPQFFFLFKHFFALFCFDSFWLDPMAISLNPSALMLSPRQPTSFLKNCDPSWGAPGDLLLLVGSCRKHAIFQASLVALFNGVIDKT